MTCKLGQKNTFFCCGIAAAHHIDVLSGKELAVTGGTVGNAPAFEFLFPLEPNRSGMGTGGQQYPETAVVAPVGVHRLDVPGKVKGGRFRQHKLCAKCCCLLLHRIRKCLAAGPLNAGIIDYLVGNGDLAAKLQLFQNKHPVFRPGKVKGGS